MSEPARVLPDYAGGSIVNLMRTVADASGGPTTGYPPLRALDADLLRDSRTLVVLLIDGLGYRFLDTVGARSRLREHLRSTMTSVFPSTTASAITAIMTGTAAQQHGLTGWHIHLRELGRVLAILPLTPRTGPPLEDAESLPDQLFHARPLFDALRRPAYVVSPASICDSPFNRYHAGRASRIPYRGLDELFAAIESVIRGDDRPKLVYAYYADLDATAHHHGIASREAARVFHTLDEAFGAFLSRIKGTGTRIVATADHGFIDSPEDRVIDANQHPEFLATLTQPLCGERRAAYCYVREDRRDAFVRYVTEVFGHAVDMIPSHEALESNWFGLGTPLPELAHRIGDYTLVMRDNWTIMDSLPGEKVHRMIGVHGGVSKHEMTVPLIVAAP